MAGVATPLNSKNMHTAHPTNNLYFKARRPRKPPCPLPHSCARSLPPRRWAVCADRGGAGGGVQGEVAGLWTGEEAWPTADQYISFTVEPIENPVTARAVPRSLSRTLAAPRARVSACAAASGSRIAAAPLMIGPEECAATGFWWGGTV